jgi:uncharacterized membrane protein (UPF0127 family)
MRYAWLLASALVLLLSACADSAEAPHDENGDATVRFTRAGHEATIQVEIADTPEERAHGLMNRESLDEDAGMLFVWPEDTASGFWMKDTTIPLSIAFVTEAGSVIDIQDMEPLDETLRHAPQPYRYAVEANQGWFDDNDVELGDLVQLPVGLSQ